MTKPLATQFLEEIEEFLDKHGDTLTPTAFGIAVQNNGHLVRDLRAGASVRSTTIDAAREFMRKYRSRERAA